jgi:hypothetical protein
MALKRNRSSSQLNKLEGGKYNFTRFNYPADGLASDKIPNYVIFYINVPQTAGYNVTKVVSGNQYEYSNSEKLIPKTRRESKIITELPVDTGKAVASFNAAENAIGGSVRPIENIASGAGAAIITSVASGIEKRPKLNRIRTAIAMYMPDTVVQTFSHDYDAISIRDALGQIGLAQRGGVKTVEAITNATSSDVTFAEGVTSGVREVLGRLAERTGLVNQGFTELVLKSKGIAINPQIEMVYKQTRNRSFIFDFRLQSRSSLESRNIKNIIREFKRYSAPSLAVEGQTDASYFTIPAQFDIQFMFKNEENRFIGKISTCALENIDVNYSSAGPFATFDDGAPVEIALQLRFIEVDTITKEVYEDDAGGVDSSYSDGPSF